jgi:hypothetical protein
MKNLKLFLEFNTKITKEDKFSKFVDTIKRNLEKSKSGPKREPISIKNWKTY